MMATALAERGLRPVADLAANRSHGDRLLYLAGCRCTDCRRANTRYESARQAARKAGDFNGIVSAENARKHLAFLRDRNIGRRTVCDVSGVADTVLQEINSGRKTQIRARTERAILAVTEAAAADSALVDAAATWRLLDELIADGYTKTELARRLAHGRALQIRRSRVTVRSAFNVARLYERLRMCEATKTLALLEDLSEEGFHRARVRALLTDMAQRAGTEPPMLAARKGRILNSTAVLVAKLHAQLTAE